MLQLMRSKHTPGPLSTYLVNTVITPILAYRLQATPVNVSQLNEINTKLRQFVQAKHTFKYLPNLFLYENHIGIQLNDFKSIIDQRQISNALVIQRNQDITGQIQRHLTSVISDKLNLRYNIISHPINKELRVRVRVIFISATFYMTMTYNSERSMKIH
jgi:hypothetical protein